MGEEIEKPTVLTRVWRLLCCFHEGTYCWWLVKCCPFLEPPPPKPDIQYILQHSDLTEDSVSTSSTSLLRHTSGTSSLSSSVTSVKDAKDVKDLKADIYHQGQPQFQTVPPSPLIYQLLLPEPENINFIYKLDSMGERVAFYTPSTPPAGLFETGTVTVKPENMIELRRSNSIGSKKLPVIDIRPIEFWSGVKGEGVQPKLFGQSTSPGIAMSPNPFPRSPKWFEKKMAEYEDLTKQIRPHLYESTSSSIEETIEEEDLGRLHFAFHYDVSEALLVVRVIEGVDLPPPANKDRLDQASSNPYVRVSLLPDGSSAKETAVKKKTQDPIFEETFAFQIPYPEVTRRTLELKVKDFDKFSRHCVIGRIQVPLGSVDLARPCRIWRPLMPCASSENELGVILLSLNFLPTAGRLNVDIIKAKQLLRTSLLRGADPYVRVSLVVRGRHHKSKKTSVKRNTLEPSFHESFSFRLSSAELREASVVVTVWDFNAGVIRDEFIGRIVIGKQSTGQAESGHWASMLASERHAVAQWHSLHSRGDCDQASAASRLVP